MEEGVAFSLPTWDQIAAFYPVTLQVLMCVIVGAALVLYCYKVFRRKDDD